MASDFILFQPFSCQLHIIILTRDCRLQGLVWFAFAAHAACTRFLAKIWRVWIVRPPIVRMEGDRSGTTHRTKILLTIITHHCVLVLLLPRNPHHRRRRFQIWTKIRCKNSAAISTRLALIYYLFGQLQKPGKARVKRKRASIYWSFFFIRLHVVDTGISVQQQENENYTDHTRTHSVNSTPLRSRPLHYTDLTIDGAVKESTYTAHRFVSCLYCKLQHRDRQRHQITDWIIVKKKRRLQLSTKSWWYLVVLVPSSRKPQGFHDNIAILLLRHELTIISWAGNRRKLHWYLHNRLVRVEN